MIPEPVDILAFSPHPDDVELSCGGSLLLAAERGSRVAVVDLSAGEMASRGSERERARERETAAELLGLRDRRCLGLPDTLIASDPSHRGRVIQVVRELAPRIVLAPYWVDRHPDHEAAGRLVREATYFAGVGGLGTGAPHRPRHVYFYLAQSLVVPSFVVDVSAVWERRMAAVLAYDSQFRERGQGPGTALSGDSFLRYIEARAIHYGAMIGVAHAEAFVTRGPVPLGAIPDHPSKPLSGPSIPPYALA